MSWQGVYTNASGNGQFGNPIHSYKLMSVFPIVEPGWAGPNMALEYARLHSTTQGFLQRKSEARHNPSYNQLPQRYMDRGF